MTGDDFAMASDQRCRTWIPTRVDMEAWANSFARRSLLDLVSASTISILVIIS